VIWGVWPNDDKTWESLLHGSNKLLLDTWKLGGDRVVHYAAETQNE